MTELPEEKNTEKFFSGYMKRMDQLELLRKDVAKELEALESEKEDSSVGGDGERKEFMQ